MMQLVHFVCMKVILDIEIKELAESELFYILGIMILMMNSKVLKLDIWNYIAQLRIIVHGIGRIVTRGC